MTPETLVSEQSPFKGKTGVRRVLNALRYSMDGLRAAYTGERSIGSVDAGATAVGVLATAVAKNWPGR